jgi:hypothetical protein
MTIEKKGDTSRSFRIGLHAQVEMRNVRATGFLEGNDQWQGKAGLAMYEGLEDLLRWRMLFEIDGELGILISWVFKCGFPRRLKVMIKKLG